MIVPNIETALDGVNFGMVLNKIIFIAIVIVVVFFAWPIPYNGICNLLNNFDPCSRISGFNIPVLDTMIHYDTTFGMIDYSEEECSIVCEDENEN